MTTSLEQLMSEVDRPLPTLVLTRKEVAVVLRLGLTKTSELIRSGELPSVSVCGQVRVRLTDLIAYVDGLPVEVAR